MAKFVYKLQNVLDVKLKLESQEKTNFSMAMARLNEEEEKLEQLYNLLAEREEEYRQKSMGKLNVLELRYARDNVEYTKNMIEDQKREIAKARKSMEVARDRLNEAIKDRKIHEKLKENAFEEFMHEENEAEKKEIDQLVSFRYNDNGKEGA